MGRFFYDISSIFVKIFAMLKPFYVLLFFVSFLGFSQNRNQTTRPDTEKSKDDPKARHDQYKISTIDRDTTFVDTSLTIKSDYKYNYLRKDIFGLMPFANEGQTYNTLHFGLNQFKAYPEFGFTAKHFNYQKSEEIRYYSVATPLTELYFKTVMEQGQSVDALITLNTSERLNFAIAYKGLRSLGKYINQLSSAGNFTFTANYFTKNKRYAFNTYYAGQDLLNGENGGITTLEDFESKNPAFTNRPRLQVYLTDAKSFLKGKQFFLDHTFRINSKENANTLYITHQSNYEYKFFQFSQPTLTTTVGTNTFQRFGSSYVGSNINDQVRYYRLYNKLGMTFKHVNWGQFQFFAEDFYYIYRYEKVVILNNGVVPSLLKQRLNALGGQYEYQKEKWKAKLLYNKAVSTQTFSTIEGKLDYKPSNNNEFSFYYQNISKIPNHNYILHQSSYIAYNWNTNFDNEKINNIVAAANTQYLKIALQYTKLNDYLYFKNTASDANIIVMKPQQYTGTINYFSIKAEKEFKYKKWALDNTLLYQNVAQNESILNVPQAVARNTLYYTDHFFKKALYLQTGFTINYFTKYYANDYNPVIAEFYVQNQKQIGNFPMIDFFINGRIRQTRVFLKAEHFNSSFTGNTYYTAPNYPYRDFMVRFGLVWNFFQ